MSNVVDPDPNIFEGSEYKFDAVKLDFQGIKTKLICKNINTGGSCSAPDPNRLEN